MKKTFIISGLLAIALAMPSATYAQASLQAKPLFPFFTSEKAVVTPAPAATTQAAPVEVTEDTIDLIALKSKPLPERRRIVASELDGILLRLNVLFDKTKAATNRLMENKIDTTISNDELANAALTLANARLTIDSLIEASNNPENDSVTLLMVGKATYKDTVIKAEEELRGSRASIIASLSALKAAVAASITAPLE